MKNIFTNPENAFKSVLCTAVMLILSQFVWANQLPGEQKKEKAASQPAKQKIEEAASRTIAQKSNEISAQPVDDNFERDIEDAVQQLRSAMRENRTKYVYQVVIPNRGVANAALEKEKLDKIMTNPDLTKETKAVLYEERGMMSLLMQDFKKGGEDLDTSISILSSLPELTAGQKFALANSHYGKGAIAFYSGKFEESLAEFDTALKISPTVYMHLLKCKAFLRLGKDEEAAKAYESGMAFSEKFKAEAKDECLDLQKKGKIAKCE